MSDQQQQDREERQRILNLPPMVTALILVNVAVHVVRWFLPPDVDDALVTALAFVPLRYLVSDYFTWSAVLSPIAHQFLHAGLTHLLINMAFLAAFGSPVERRIGAWRMLVFTLVCGLAAAATHLAVYGRDPVGLIGFSGAGSGLFGAAMALPLPGSRTTPRRRILMVGGVWILLNILFGLVGAPLADGMAIAWVAHIGGFIAGVVLIGFFDPTGRVLRR